MAGEKTLEDRLRDRIDRAGGWEVKIHGSEYQSGCPDLLICYKGRFIALEVKNPNGNEKRKVLQASRIKKIREAGGIGEFIQNMSLLEDIIATIDRNETWQDRQLPSFRTPLKMDKPLRKGVSPSRSTERSST
jgi:hypothetical protein